MNILIFSPVRSHPQNEGNGKRIFTLTKYLQKLGHTIHFVYFTQSGLDKKSFDAMQNEWDSLTIIHKTNSIRKSTEGYALDEWYQEDIHPIVNEVIDLFGIDAILVNYIMQSKLLEFVPDNVLKIIDTHDIFGNRHLHINAHFSHEYTWYSVSKTDEARALNRADIVLAIQNKKAEYFSSIVDRPVKVINHYETNVKREIESLFDPEMEFPGNDLIFIDPEKQEQTIQQLYNQMQTVAFEKEEKEKELLNRNKKLQVEIKDIKKDFIVMLQAIQGMVKLPIKEHPVKKYRAYKLMLKTYFALKKQSIKKIDL